MSIMSTNIVGVFDADSRRRSDMVTRPIGRSYCRPKVLKDISDLRTFLEPIMLFLEGGWVVGATQSNQHAFSFGSVFLTIRFQFLT